MQLLPSLRGRGRVAALPFVFVIGYNKTGTTALHYFFQDNGWPSLHWDHGRLAQTMLTNAIKGRRLLRGYDHRFRVFSDMVFDTMDFRFEANSMFPALDRQYPESYFILNTRPETAWLSSRQAKYFRRFQMTMPELECRVSGLSEPSEAVNKWLLERREFEARVRSYFRGSDFFLDLDITRRDVCQQLEALLGSEFDPSKWRQVRTN